MISSIVCNAPTNSGRADDITAERLIPGFVVLPRQTGTKFAIGIVNYRNPACLKTISSELSGKALAGC